MTREHFSGYKERPPAGAWADEALCKGNTARFYLDVFTPLAKATCAVCPVRLECQEYGMDEPFGIFGGLTAQERRRVKDKRKASRKDAA